MALSGPGGQPFDPPPATSTHAACLAFVLSPGVCLPTPHIFPPLLIPPPTSLPTIHAGDEALAREVARRGTIALTERSRGSSTGSARDAARAATASYRAARQPAVVGMRPVALDPAGVLACLLAGGGGGGGGGGWTWGSCQEFFFTSDRVCCHSCAAPSAPASTPPPAMSDDEALARALAAQFEAEERAEAARRAAEQAAQNNGVRYDALPAEVSRV